MECWNKLDGNVGELSSWVATKVFIGIIIVIAIIVIDIVFVFDIDIVINIVFDILFDIVINIVFDIFFDIVITQDSSAPEGGSEISIEKLETQLNTLKTMFAEKQKLVSDLEAYGPEGL